MNYNFGYNNGYNKNNDSTKYIREERERILRYLILGITILSFIINLTLFLFPFSTDNFEEIALTPIAVLSFEKQEVITLIMFLTLCASTAISTTLFIMTLLKSKRNLGDYASAAQRMVMYNVATAGSYYVAGVSYSTIMNFKGNLYSTGSSIIPLILSIICAIIFAFVVRGVENNKKSGKKKTKRFRLDRVEFWFYGLAVSILAVVASLSNIIKVKFIQPSMLNDFTINGYKVLTTYSSRDESIQILAFFLISILTIVISLSVMSLTSFISRSKMFYKITLIQVVCGMVATLVIALFGQYYEIVQKMNESMILDWISTQISIVDIDLVYKVNSDSIYFFIAAMVIFVVMLIRKPYTKGALGDAVVRVDSVGGGYGESGHGAAIGASPTMANPDPCPAFSEIDIKSESFSEDIDALGEYTFESPSLPELVQFVVNYARDSRLHLSYTPEDIAAFIAGLGATRLTILQGMSGTGKTSLPKIFSEAIFGKCEIVEVESSWRDKNELIGYYNEFSRTYTPKKFTQALYRAKLNPEQITFIVLDEMNLSRIEYYFSDFLSLMENEEDKREIKLLNVGLYKTANGMLYPYKGLTDGHTIKIPNNVWFIGTANRDESTFEISDKVYDRAHTMNFNKRAPKVTYYHDPISQRYLSREAFLGLIEEAKRNIKFDIETSSVAREVEALLAPYNITFGNRVANQIEVFVSIYTACFTPSDEIIKQGLETILLSKVVSKLEYKSVDNKEYLASEFKRLGLNRCSEFILKLHED